MVAKAIREEYKFIDFHDAYGSVMKWWYGVADWLYHFAPDLIPDEWGYSHGAVHGECTHRKDYEYKTLAFLARNKEIDKNDIREFGNVLCRYVAILEAEGRLY